MQHVGDHLVEHAYTITDVEDRDRFARSAFNRYYYAAFLNARDLARAWANDTEKSIAHKDLPKHIRKRLLTKLTEGLKKAYKRKTIADRDYQRLSPAADNACRKLAHILEEAYSLRVIADYEPDKRVSEVDGRFVLSGTTVKDARRWPQDSASYVKVITEAMDHVRIKL